MKTALLIIVSGILMLAQQAPPPPAPAKVKKDRTLGYDDTDFIPGQKWRVHDIARPRPVLITPASEGKAPSDAVVLFEGKDLSQWMMYPKGAQQPVPPAWKVENGYMEIAPRSGSLRSKEKFGDCQIHVEWAEPAEVPGKGQAGGNSGIAIMGRYEIQVLESFYNQTYADGQAASIYGQWPPMVNASRKPGEWQTYDIFFEAPRFEGEKLARPAHVTLVHNGVLVHHRQELTGPVAHARVRQYTPHAAEESLTLQDHGHPIRFRNVWVRRIKGYDQQ